MEKELSEKARPAQNSQAPESQEISAQERFKLDWEASLGSGENQGDPLEGFLSKNGVPEESRPFLRRRLAELWDILSGLGTALGGENELRFRIGRWWSTDLETRTVSIPLQEVLKHLENLPALVGGIVHEAGHVFYTRLHKLPLYEKLLEKTGFPMPVHALFNVLEDLFQEHAKTRRWPGTAFYLKALHEAYRPDLFSGDLALPEELKGSSPKQAEEELIKRLFPHEEYLEALRSFWITRRFPDQKSFANPEAAKAVSATAEPVSRLLTLLPAKLVPSEEERLVNSYGRMKLIEREILPHYLELVNLSRNRLENALEEARKGTGSSGQGKPGSGQPSQPAGGASRIIDSRAGKISKILCPTHGHGHHQDPESLPLEPAKQGAQEANKPAQGPGQGLAEKQKSEQPRPDAPPPPGSTAGENRGELKLLELVKRLVAQHEEVLKAVAPTITYENHLSAVHHLIEAFAGRLENIFAKNERPDWEGFFKTGQKIGLKKWIRSESRGWKNPDDFKVFERRRLPVKRDYKFTLLIDLSGSMGGRKMDLALQTVILFLEVLERLGIDHSLLGFSDKAYAFKKFAGDSSSLRALSPEEKNLIVENMKKSGGGSTYDTEAVYTALRGDPTSGISGLEDQTGERRVLIVVTDGDGNGEASAKMDQVLARAARKGIEVIGIGVGEGMAYVEKRYPKHVLEPDMESLPEKIGDVLEEEIESGFAEGAADLEDQ